MLKTLLTSWEVKKHGPVSREYPVADICKHIRVTEHTEFAKCFGRESYRAFIDALTVIPEEEDVELWVDGLPGGYALDKYVHYDGVVFKSLEAANAADIYDETKWELQQKFKYDCLNEVWANSMVYWLSFLVISKTLSFTTFRIGAKGAMVQFDQNSRTVDRESFYALKKELIAQANLYEDMVHADIGLVHNDKVNYDCGAFDWSKVTIANDTTTGDIKQGPMPGRRIAFKH